MTHVEAITAYKNGSPLRTNSNSFKEDIATIRSARRPVEAADRLVKKRKEQSIHNQVKAMLFELQGRRKRYDYNSAAAQKLAHLWPSPLDPITQMPLWLELLKLTRGRSVSQETFLRFATDILCQHDLHNSSNN